MSNEIDIFPEFYTGPPVDSTDLRYRDEFLDDLWENICSSHILLTAPRRTGKTSVMDHLVAHPRNGFIVLKENVQDLSHPADVLLSLLARFHDEHPALLRDTLSNGWALLKKAFTKLESLSVSEFKVALRESDPNWKENWRKHGEDLLRQLRKHDSPVLLIIDELPDMLLNKSLKALPRLVPNSTPSSTQRGFGTLACWRLHQPLLHPRLRRYGRPHQRS